MALVQRDVIVVGAGPAGAICAGYLAKAGLDVLLLDKDVFPRDKVSGDAVREGFVEHIHALENVSELDAMSTCVRNVKVISKNHEAIMPFECYVLPRYKMDKMLIEMAVSWGAEFKQGCRVVEVINHGGAVKGVIAVEKGVKKEFRSAVVVGADGVNSEVIRLLGIEEEKPESIWMGLRAYFKGVKIDKSLSKDQYNAGGIFGFDDEAGPAYFWIMPSGADGVKKGICNVGMMAKGRDRHELSALRDRMINWLNGEKIAPMFEEAEQLADWSFGRMGDEGQNDGGGESQRRKLAGDGYVLIGDAYSKVPFFFGDGLTTAANSAKAAAYAIAKAFDKDEFGEEVLQPAYEAEFARLQEKTAGKRQGTTEAEDKTKLNRLLMESMEDSNVMDLIVEKLV